MKLFIFFFQFCLASLLIFQFTSCKKDKDDDTDNPPVTLWEKGSVTSVQVNVGNGEQLTEPVNQLTFLFPEGGQGTLEIAPAIKTPEPPVQGKGIYINFTGSQDIQLLIPEDTSKIISVWGWGTNLGLMEDNVSREAGWVSIPYKMTNDNVRAFLLLMPGDINLKKTNGKHTGFNYYYIAIIDKTTLFGSKEVYLRADLKNMIDKMLDSLKPSLETVVSDRLEHELAYQFNLGSEAYYMPFWWSSGEYIIRTEISQDQEKTNPGLITSSLAHELGHYMTHLFVGNDIYYNMYNQMPYSTVNHGPGEPTNRRAYYIEEPAYFSEYFHTGKVSSVSDPTEPRLFLWDNNNMPIKTDFPGLEGFGVAMLAGLHRTNSQIYSVWQTNNSLVKTDIPVISASFQDIFSIIARGATSIDSLRVHIKDYLASKGKEDLLSPYLQRLGWGYYVSMKIVDKSGNPIEGVKAKNICTAGGKTWYGGYYSTPSGADGKYNLPGEVFGGKSVLRFYKGTDSVDVEIDIDWLKKTNETINLGNITVDFTTPPTPYLEAKDYGLYIGSIYQWKCPEVVQISPRYMPANYNANGSYIPCSSDGAGTLTANWENTLSGGSHESCAVSGTVMPHHTDNSGWLPIHYYSFNLNFDYKYYINTESIMFRFTGTITGIDRLDPYIYTHLTAAGTITLYWTTDDVPYSCSYQDSLINGYLHNFAKK